MPSGLSFFFRNLTLGEALKIGEFDDFSLLRLQRYDCTLNYFACVLKNLTSLGHSIKSSAKLPIAELERRIEESARPDIFEGPPTSHACRICVVGGYVGTILDGIDVMPERAVKVAEFPDLDSAVHPA